MMTLLEQEGFKGKVHSFIEKHMYLLGERVKILDKNLKDIVLEGKFEKFNEDGTVKIVDDQGKVHDLNDGRMRKHDF